MDVLPTLRCSRKCEAVEALGPVIGLHIRDVPSVSHAATEVVLCLLHGEAGVLIQFPRWGVVSRLCVDTVLKRRVAAHIAHAHHTVNFGTGKLPYHKTVCLVDFAAAMDLKNFTGLLCTLAGAVEKYHEGRRKVRSGQAQLHGLLARQDFLEPLRSDAEHDVFHRKTPFRRQKPPCLA